MDKFIQKLAAQNPKYNITCSNPGCNKVTSVDTIKVLSAPHGVYEHACPHCKAVTNLTGIDQWIKTTKAEFKKIGLSW